MVLYEEKMKQKFDPVKKYFEVKNIAKLIGDPYIIKISWKAGWKWDPETREEIIDIHYFIISVDSLGDGLFISKRFS